MPTPKYSRTDKLIWAARIPWTGVLCLVFIAGTAYGLLAVVHNGFWTGFWLWHIQLTLAVAVGITLWCLIGAAFGFCRFIQRFKTHQSPKQS